MNDRSERDERDIRIQKFNKREELESKLFLLSDAFCLFVSVNWLAVELLSKLVTSSLSLIKVYEDWILHWIRFGCCCKKFLLLLFSVTLQCVCRGCHFDALLFPFGLMSLFLVLIEQCFHEVDQLCLECNFSCAFKWIFSFLLQRRWVSN